jgi:hypothetical protein
MRARTTSFSGLGRPIGLLALLTVCFVSTSTDPLLTAIGSTRAHPAKVPRGSHLGRPMRFECNEGQLDPRAHYVARGGEYTAFLTSTGPVITLERQHPTARGATRDFRDAAATDSRVAVTMSYLGAAAASRMRGEDPVPSTTNYFLGGSASQWIRSVLSFGKIIAEDVYPGVDAVYYGSDDQLEYDFRLRPGAITSSIRVRFSGQDRLRINGQGDLVINTAYGDLVQRRPTAYEEAPEGRHSVPCSFVLYSKTDVGFQVGMRDSTRTLIIDPVLTYSSYFGGTGSDKGTNVAVDGARNLYVAGSTDSLDFPSTSGVVQIGTTGTFIAKLNPEGTAVIYTIIIGGVGFAQSIAADVSGAVYVTGFTNSVAFPTTPGAFQPTFGGVANVDQSDAFVAKISPDGSTLVYSTYLGGSGLDYPSQVVADASGNAYVVGFTNSTDFPVVRALQQAIGGGRYDAFVTKLDSSGAHAVYSTFLGGAQDDDALGVHVDSSGSALVTGQTSSVDFPTTSGVVQGAYAGGALRLFDAFVARLSPDGNTLEFSTYLGRADQDLGTSVTSDSAGFVYVAGRTESVDFPTVNPLPSSRPGQEMFVCKLDSMATHFVYSTHLGGTDYVGNYRETPTGLAVDATGCVYVIGIAASRDFPIYKSLQFKYGGGRADAFVTKIAPRGDRLVYSTYLGGKDIDIGAGGTGIALDASGVAYIAGTTTSDDFPTTSGALQRSLRGRFDTFVARITDFYELTWDAPDANASIGTSTVAGPPAPRNLVALVAPEGRLADTHAPARPRAPLTGYNVYRSSAPGVMPTPANLFQSLPPTQTTTGPAVLGGAFFVVTATYSDGTESGPSNEASGGGGESNLGPTTVSAKGLIQVGTDFTSEVQVFFDGIPFVDHARVKRAGTKVLQRGNLLTGDSIDQYLSHHSEILITFRNSNGGVASTRYTSR